MDAQGVRPPTKEHNRVQKYHTCHSLRKISEVQKRSIDQNEKTQLVQKVKRHVQGMMVFVSFVCQGFVFIQLTGFIRMSVNVVFKPWNCFDAKDRKYVQKDQ